MTREEILYGLNPFDESRNYAVIVLHSTTKYNVYVSLYKDDYEDKAAYKVYRERTDGTLEFINQLWHYGSYSGSMLKADIELDVIEIVNKLNLSLDDFNGTSFLSPKILEFLLK